MLLARLVEVSAQVAGTGSRLAKRDLIADLLAEVAAEDTDAEVDIAASYLSGTLRQRRTGVGGRGLTDVPPPAADASVSLTEADATLERISALAGSGLRGRTPDAVGALFERLTAAEQDFLKALMTGNVRQGAADSVMLDAIAAAAGLPAEGGARGRHVQRAHRTDRASRRWRGCGRLEAFSLVVGRPVRPMLAGAAPDVRGRSGQGRRRLRGRPQARRHPDPGAQARRGGPVFTRSLDDISARLPEVVDADPYAARDGPDPRR